MGICASDINAAGKHNLEFNKGNHYHANHTEKTKEALKNYFPGAMAGSTVEEISYRMLSDRGFTDANTLYCDCSCPDEVNHDNPLEDVTTMFTNRWGEVFNLGGLAGLPFTGQTGFGAFAAHVPVDGNIVLMFAPHIGIDANGVLGKVLRDG
jgi:hypothetical protein